MPHSHSDSLEVLPISAQGRLALLSGFPLLRGLPSEALRELAETGRVFAARRRQHVFRQGDTVRTVSMLASGLVKLTQATESGREVILRINGSGELLGGLAGAGSHSCSAVALETCQVLTWSAERFVVVLDRTPALARNAARVLAERIRALEEQCVLLATRKVPERLAALLLALAGRYGRPTEDGTLLPLTREEFAQLAGTTLFSASRLLALWEAQGIVRSRREAVIVLAAEPLAALAVGESAAAAAGA